MEGASNDLLVFGLDLSASKARIGSQIQQIVKEVSGNGVQVTASLNVPESQKIIQSQLNSITKNLNVNVNTNVDTKQFNQQAETLSKEASASVNNSFSAIQSGANQVNLSGLSQQFKQVQTQTQSTNTTSQGFFSNLKTGLKSSIAQMLKFQLAYKIIKTTQEAIKAMVKSVVELDGVLTEFNKVADLSADELSKFADKAYESAAKIGRTGKDMIEASTEFKKAGKSLDESLELGNSALVMTNVADGINRTSDAASTLISVLNGFKLKDSEAMSVVDKMNEVSNNSPIGFDNIADGLERVSGTMRQTGSDINETIGLLTGGYAELRDISKVSTGLITISQRLRAIDEDGEAIDGLSAELQDSFGSIGVNIEDANGNLRSTYQILHDYAQVFPELTDKQRQYFGELAAGKRQINVFNAIVDEMAVVDTAIEQSKNSMGSAEKENETYRKSIQGLKNELQNQWQMLANEVIDSDWIKDLISAATDFLGILTDIVKQDDLISGSIGIITEGIKGLASILKDISGNKVIGSIIKGFMTMKTVQTGLDIFSFFKGEKTGKSAMNAFFESALNGTMQVKNGFLQIGEAEKKLAMDKNSSGIGKQSLLLVA